MYREIREAITLYFVIFDICKAEANYFDKYAAASKIKKKKMKPPEPLSIERLFLKVSVNFSLLLGETNTLSSVCRRYWRWDLLWRGRSAMPQVGSVSYQSFPQGRGVRLVRNPIPSMDHRETSGMALLPLFDLPALTPVGRSKEAPEASWLYASCGSSPQAGT